jgi:hypothetical protein
MNRRYCFGSMFFISSQGAQVLKLLLFSVALAKSLLLFVFVSVFCGLKKVSCGHDTYVTGTNRIFRARVDILARTTTDSVIRDTGLCDRNTEHRNHRRCCDRQSP